MQENLWRFIDNLGSFESKTADKIKNLYFPLANETLMSSISPDLHGDIKTGQNSFLLTPVSRIDLINSRSSRNFWVYIDKNKIWSATGVSKNLKQITADKFLLEAGLLWQKITRRNIDIGLQAEILSFIPAGKDPVEVMQVKVTNISRKAIKFIPTAAIPIYARSANNLRDHRQVSSLLQRISLHKFGVMVKPTLVFDESGHRPNKNIYFVFGWDENFKAPQYIYPTQEMFCGNEGDLEAPTSVLENLFPTKERIQGKESMGALRFHSVKLAPRETYSYIILMGIAENPGQIKNIILKFNSLKKAEDALKNNRAFWRKKSQEINLATGDPDLDNWFRWVSIQPTLRRIFGCSFLPDFDYGKGGRGWRDLWQDCLGLILSNPKPVREILINNFAGVRMDGSNATIIGKKPGEFTPLETRRQRRLTVASGNLSLTGFIADRNNISRVWMDHGIWPLLTLDSYINETGDFDILLEETTYFRDHQIFRSRAFDPKWNSSYGNKLRTASGRIYKGSILEHILIQNLVQFFNVGSHNHVRLEGADWNDGLDMAKEFGESVAFSCMYAQNLRLLAELLEKLGKPKVKICQEIKLLLEKVNYNSVSAKNKILEKYFSAVKSCVSGEKIALNTHWLVNNLKEKADWMMAHIRKKEWLRQRFFNGYYDNKKERVEGLKGELIRMTLTGQVFPIMSGVATKEEIKKILKSVKKYLWDKKLKGYHLNTDFKAEQYHLGRAFSFVYGDKENGAFFNHMIVMFAYALYKRGFSQEGWQVLSSVYNMASNTARSKIYPCIPEYFNLEGRGMYSYLTGSASWFVLTLLTQNFGVKGRDGDLVIEPKLCPEQFRKFSEITINRIFADRHFQVRFLAAQKPKFATYRIIKANLNSRALTPREDNYVIIKRKTILGLPKAGINKINIILG